MKHFYLTIITLFCLLPSCLQKGDSIMEGGRHNLAMEEINKPFARYWWFASEIKREDIEYNLNWLKARGFGGVELAWVYPLNAMDTTLPQSRTPRQEWLSPDWQEIVEYAMLYADSIGLACDLTMGTLWPFGDSYVSYEQASQQYGREERQTISRSWEAPKKAYVVDHLQPEHYMQYFKRMLDSFPLPPLTLSPSFFIDSWEVETKGLWYDGLKEEFSGKFGYDIEPFMDSLYMPGSEDHLYDYMKLISEKVVSFYENYDRILDEHDIYSRGQCSGAPCDIISAYSRLDIPEGEAMLYEPEYNAIPASAAILSGKNIVSAETFTCLYGWPRNYLREEQTADLKMVADALFANGINHIIWHGKAHNPAGQDSVNFYATVHLGDSGMLARELPSFNDYLARLSGYMKEGKPYTDVAVYLPTEDAWIKGVMPPEKQFIWAWGYYEMRYVYFPETLKGYHPTWINREFLEKAVYEKDILRVGDASFSHLYVNVSFLDYETLKIIAELAKKGLPLTLTKIPDEAGSIRHNDWKQLLSELTAFPNVQKEFRPYSQPLITGKQIPPYRARETEAGLLVFFANPNTEGIKFPVGYGQSYQEGIKEMKLRVNYDKRTYDLNLEFKASSSLLYRLKDGQAEELDIVFTPDTPVIKDLPPGFRPPWLVN